MHNTLQEYLKKSCIPHLKQTRRSNQKIPLLVVDFHPHTNPDFIKSVKYAGHRLKSKYPAHSNASDDPKTDFNVEHTTSSVSGMHHGTCIQQSAGPVGCVFWVIAHASCSHIIQ